MENEEIKQMQESGGSLLNDGLCNENSFFDLTKIKTSEFPANFIPAGAKEFVFEDKSEGGICTIKGFYDPTTGEQHIQEMVHNVKVRGAPVAGLNRSRRARINHEPSKVPASGASL